MNDVVDVFLILAGLIEFTLRIIVILALFLTIIGALVIFVLIGERFNRVATPYLWKILAENRGVND